MFDLLNNDQINSINQGQAVGQEDKSDLLIPKGTWVSATVVRTESQVVDKSGNVLPFQRVSLRLTAPKDVEGIFLDMKIKNGPQEPSETPDKAKSRRERAQAQLLVLDTAAGGPLMQAYRAGRQLTQADWDRLNGARVTVQVGQWSMWGSNGEPRHGNHVQVIRTVKPMDAETIANQPPVKLIRPEDAGNPKGQRPANAIGHTGGFSDSNIPF